jgi:hypothetical protein
VELSTEGMSKSTFTIITLAAILSLSLFAHRAVLADTTATSNDNGGSGNNDKKTANSQYVFGFILFIYSYKNIFKEDRSYKNAILGTAVVASSKQNK